MRRAAAASAAGAVAACPPLPPAISVDAVRLAAVTAVAGELLWRSRPPAATAATG